MRRSLRPRPTAKSALSFTLRSTASTPRAKGSKAQRLKGSNTTPRRRISAVTAYLLRPKARRLTPEREFALPPGPGPITCPITCPQGLPHNLPPGPAPQPAPRACPQSQLSILPLSLRSSLLPPCVPAPDPTVLARRPD